MLGMCRWLKNFGADNRQHGESLLHCHEIVVCLIFSGAELETQVCHHFYERSNSQLRYSEGNAPDTIEVITNVVKACGFGWACV